MIDCAPQVVRLANDLYDHLIDVLAALSEASHPVDPLPLDIRSKHRAEPVLSEPHCFVADIESFFRKKIFDITQAQRKADVHHHHKPNDLGR